MSYRQLLRQLGLELSYRTVRQWFGNRPVIRDVQGVSLAMPWYHRLPDYARLFPTYGQNLISLAVGLAETDKPLGVIDVGANIGDSARQLLAKVDARILCIEGDPEYLPYLRRNVGSDDRCVIDFALLVTDVAEAAGLGAIRKGGDTRFAPGGTGGAAAALTVSELPQRHPELPPIRLIKSDTEGYDTTLIPPLARAYADTCPVLLFEYYPELTRMAGVPDPAAVWGELQTAGYAHAGIWDNFGRPVRALPVDELPAAAAVLDKRFAERGYHYWDVAAVHADDGAGRAVLDRLFAPAP
ncbi:hypothetical protein B1987_23630 [Mycobacterium kansasii]|uniref:Methyltransferase FkbM domain-containing protein n=1 Tax=Mycobacterium attenuatum TaxID=2341086 RepID=A0A498PVQ6_9MYCO|nr:FkbM family methyltransferase [Mycobacterium attenuatum]ORB86262.1 hypothetical protein B1987_23630 [Mycobacterium kansasii]VBA37007.1 hypothetical protein LAUMK136_01706 [Mycobacterium attenuatum]VBA49849.1 hypothetical protein LAUMK191_01697 [Mycobacterium attenuatum]VBA55427.1 hypothetical protein LAUMK41_01772 [Mycobacterium attenuatum]